MTIEIITILKAKCPICNHMFEQWYCPSCGLPISTTDRRRPEYNHFEDIQLCGECNTTNPYEAKFCRNCGKDMSLQAKDSHGHGWVDLGLSVLWSTEAVDGYYYWMDTVNILEHNTCESVASSNYRQEDDLKHRILAGKDTATYKWGHKWRMPTKEEFKELIEKCSLELEQIPFTNRYHQDKTTIKALKVTGPNGNYIYLPALGQADGSYSHSSWWNSFVWHPKICYTGFKYWCSTKEINNDNTHTQTYVFNPRFLGLYSDMSEKLQERQRLLFSSSTPIDERMKLFMHTEYIYKSGNYKAYVVRPVADKKWKGKL